jgi:rSAM/selenodomain-associated transferase 2
LPPYISVIIPVLDDAAALSRLIAQIVASADYADYADSRLCSDGAEVIVACAAPIDDDTARLRQRYPGIVWVAASPGRGTQLNAGAARAQGEWLWFVHADSHLPDGWLAALRNLDASSNEVVGGAFRFALDSQVWQARLLERAVAARVCLFDLPYGDQGIFVRRSVFDALGGFAPIPLMEDVEFVRRLKRKGRLRHLTLSLTTSARRWERDGWWRRSANNLLTLALYAMGVSPGRLAKRYDGGRRA